MPQVLTQIYFLFHSEIPLQVWECINKRTTVLVPYFKYTPSILFRDTASMYKTIKVGLHIKNGLRQKLLMLWILKVIYGPQNQNLKWCLQ